MKGRTHRSQTAFDRYKRVTALGQKGKSKCSTKETRLIKERL